MSAGKEPLMYLHIGQNVVVPIDTIVGIFDIIETEDGE